jgi:hypothetical protein
MSLRFFHSFKAVPEDSPQELQEEAKTCEHVCISAGDYGAGGPLDDSDSNEILISFFLAEGLCFLIF